jgi:SagB-type dehydrogenase family enzyme
MDRAEAYDIVKRYHEQTKHHPHRYARSPGYMDWDNQPIPFRTYEGAPHIELTFLGEDRGLPYAALYQSYEGSPAPISIQSIANMLELSMGLSAWKAFGTAEWALRMNPSSGNLHPTECYLVLPELPGQKACVTHYNPYRHVLEVRASFEDQHAVKLNNGDGFGIILTSVPWREAWKYGERAYRYCNHDLGHALGALRFACNLNGWKMTLLPQITEHTLDHFLGFDRINWPDDEQEHADCLCWVDSVHGDADGISNWFYAQDELNYDHKPNQLSSDHMSWDIIDAVQNASQSDGPAFLDTSTHVTNDLNTPTSPFTAEAVIRRRRSAQSYNRTTSRTDLHTFLHSLERTLPRQGCPFDVFPHDPQVHLALFIHAVDGLDSGLYMLVRNPQHFESLKSLTDSSFDWHQVKEGLPFYRLKTGDFRSSAQSISCTQAIAGDSAYALGMIARFDSVLREAPSMYPRLFWETGLVGQVLYLEAEAQDMRATGIGCFFDDQMHGVLGLQNTEWQSLYHFTVGQHVEDTRLETKPPYHHIQR